MMDNVPRSAAGMIVGLALWIGVGCSYNPPTRGSVDSGSAGCGADGGCADVSSDPGGADTQPSGSGMAPGASCDVDEACRSVCVDGTCAHRIFVTARQWKGDLGGLEGADRKCRDAAEAADLAGSWRAVISDYDTGARDRLEIGAPIVRMDDATLAEGAGDLWSGEIARPVSYTGAGVVVDQYVWTGSNADGSRDHVNDDGDGEYCDDWTSQSGEGEVGSSVRQSYRWLLHFENGSCDNAASLYCIDGQ